MITNKIQLFFLINGFILCSLVIASESGSNGEHAPSIYDLKWSAVNFAILFSLLIYKLKAPISNAFKERKKQIESLFNHAAEKNKDAEMKLELYEGKLNSIGDQSKKILDDAKSDMVKFDQESHEEHRNLVARINKDAKDKIVNEQQQIVRKLGEELLTAVIAKTKSNIDQSEDLKGSLGASLLKKAK